MYPGTDFKLKKDVRLTPFDESDDVESYLVRYGKRMWQVSLVVYLIGEIIADEAKDKDRIYKELISSDRIEDGADIPASLVDEALDFYNGKGLLEGTDDPEQQKKKEGFWLRFTLFPPKFVNRYLKPFHVLYYKFPFWLIMPLGVLTFLYLLIRYPSSSISNSLLQMSPSVLIMAVVLGVFQALFHETGHMSALMHFGKPGGEIGAGLYLIMPVVYSNVENSWELKRGQRVYVDIGGIYFQAIIGSVLFWLNYFLWKNQSVFIACVMSASTIVLNISPVLRFDGYWLARDAFGTTNPSRTLKELRNGTRQMPTWKKLLFYIYYYASILILIYFMFIIISSVVMAAGIIYKDVQYLVTHFGRLSISLESALEYITSKFGVFLSFGFGIYMSSRYLRRLVKAIAGIRKEKRHAE